jgi:alanine racemase
MKAVPSSLPSVSVELAVGSGARVPYRCWAEVDLEALRENLAWIRHRVGSGVRIMTVVKADAYGHGLRQIAGHLMRCGTDAFGVANLTEARAVRGVGRGWPVLMLGACLPDEVEWAVRDGVTMTVSSEAEARGVSQAACRMQLQARLQVKVDTGMGRLGIEPRRAVELVARIRALPGLQLEGIYTHFAAVEDDPEFTAEQRRRFQRLLPALKRTGLPIPVLHAANSGGLLHEPEAWFDMVRPGLLVYGVVPSGARAVSEELRARFRPALSLRARVSRVRDVPRGTTVSYGHTYTTPRRMRLATISAGYGDGFSRMSSGRATVLIRGRRCRVVGRVTMDQTVVDVGSAPGVEEGDEVVLVGRQGDAEVTAVELAELWRTIPWEVLTGISYRVPRVYRGAQAS